MTTRRSPSHRPAPKGSRREEVKHMGLKEAKRNLKGMGKTIASNTPGPAQLAQGFRETAKGIWVVWAIIAFLLVFGNPIGHWLAH